MLANGAHLTVPDQASSHTMDPRRATREPNGVNQQLVLCDRLANVFELLSPRQLMLG